MNVLYAGLITWFVTLVLVEGEIFAPLRDWFEYRTDLALLRDRYAETTKEHKKTTRRYRVWNKVSYLVNCHMCAGTWIGIGLGFLIPGPFSPVLSGLLYKAIGHLTLAVQKTFERFS